MISYAWCSSEAIAWPTLEMCVLFHVLLSTRMVLQMEDILWKWREIRTQSGYLFAMAVIWYP